MNQNAAGFTAQAPPPKPCTQCGSGNIVTGISFRMGVEAGQFGLQYKAWGPLTGTEKVRADLCPNCGLIQRFYVSNPQRNWVRD
jgi:hypothetical protein